MKNKLKILNENFGFSLLELMIVIGVLSIMAAIGLDFYGNYIRTADVDRQAKTMMFDLRQARDKAMAGQDDRHWGVHFVNGVDDYYEIFSTPTNYADGAKTIETKVYLEGNVKFSDPTESFTRDAVFTKISATTTPASVTISADGSDKTVNISGQGRIE